MVQFYLKDINYLNLKQDFRSFCEALQPLQTCEDSLQSIGIRKLLSQADGVYKAVDTEAVADTYIGLHNDCTYTLAPPYAAFVCFQQASKGGGEFLLADGREILRNLNPDVVHTMYNRGLRVRVAGIPTPIFLSTNDKANNIILDFGSELLKMIVSWGVTTFLPKLQLNVCYSKDRDILQIMEPLKSPINGQPRNPREVNILFWYT